MDNKTELWEEYMETRDPSVRDELIVENLPLVRYVLGRLTLPPMDDEIYNDLLGQGVLGLIDAVDRFEPKRGLRFSTYATLRIRGCILDALRAMDILPRGARRRVKDIERAITRLRTKLGREPQDKEVASALDMDLKSYQSALVEANCAVLSLDTLFEADDENSSSLRDYLYDDESPGPEDLAQDGEMQGLLTEAILQLSQRTQILLALYYYEGLTMKEIGEILELSESRVSQLHARAVANLRTKLTYRRMPSTHSSRPLGQATPALVFASG
jgi:RNA polymerase sigma factor for flagellar operon FliA